MTGDFCVEMVAYLCDFLCDDGESVCVDSKIVWIRSHKVLSLFVYGIAINLLIG